MLVYDVKPLGEIKFDRETINQAVLKIINHVDNLIARHIWNVISSSGY